MRRDYTANEIREMKIRRNRIRRERQLRRRIAFAISIFIIVLFASFGMTSIISRAQDTPVEAKAKCYTSVMIPYGTSLSEMAQDYIDLEFYEDTNAYIKEVMFINHLTDTNIKAGNYLIMPYYQSL